MNTAQIYYPMEAQADRLRYESNDGCVAEGWQRWNDNLVKEFSIFLRGVLKGAAALGIGTAAIFLAMMYL